MKKDALHSDTKLVYLTRRKNRNFEWVYRLDIIDDIVDVTGTHRLYHPDGDIERTLGIETDIQIDGNIIFTQDILEFRNETVLVVIQNKTLGYITQSAYDFIPFDENNTKEFSEDAKLSGNTVDTPQLWVMEYIDVPCYSITSDPKPHTRFVGDKETIRTNPALGIPEFPELALENGYAFVSTGDREIAERVFSDLRASGRLFSIRYLKVIRYNHAYVRCAVYKTVFIISSFARGSVCENTGRFSFNLASACGLGQDDCRYTPEIFVHTKGGMNLLYTTSGACTAYRNTHSMGDTMTLFESLHNAPDATTDGWYISPDKANKYKREHK